ncbi:MAG: DUF3820 family protein [Chlamydiales bacterium]|nr:DUF3820 family protein [Chlamydiales bacterium]
MNKDVFVCIDCETTGLSPKENKVIEIAIVKFRGDEHLSSFETLINPECDIPEDSIKIHHITNDMVKDKPTIKEILPSCLKLIQGHIIIGHGVFFDMEIMEEEAKRFCIPCEITKQKYIDTLRLARLYGDSPTNSLQQLRQHFNIPQEGAHRAMSDVVVNIQVFLQLSKHFNSTKDILERLKKPIRLKNMPLGKHKGRPFAEIPIDYLLWAGRQDFDQDLLFSIRSEINRRKTNPSFRESSNPFSTL